MKTISLVGFWEGDVEVKPDVYKPNIVEREYICDVTRQVRRFQNSENQNDNLNVTNRVSILSDLYAKENWFSIRYIVLNGVSWNVNSVEMNYPRINLEIGGLYNNERQSGTRNETEENLGVK